MNTLSGRVVEEPKKVYVVSSGYYQYGPDAIVTDPVRAAEIAAILPHGTDQEWELDNYALPTRWTGFVLGNCVEVVPLPANSTLPDGIEDSDFGFRWTGEAKDWKDAEQKVLEAIDTLYLR